MSGCPCRAGDERSKPGSDASELVLYEELNQAEPMTCLYRAAGPDGLAAINRALDDCEFAPAAVHACGLRAAAAPDTAGARLLASALAAQVPHDAGWQDRISQLLPGSEGGP